MSLLRVPGSEPNFHRVQTSPCGPAKRSRCPSRRDVLKYASGVPLLLSMPVVPSATANAEASIAGKIVFLDPGHNGANDGSITRQVSDGRGRTKECQTSGTTTDAGFPEHTFNWNVVLRIRQALTGAGVRTALSRGNDNALGPCIDQRAATANSFRPDAIISIHADGGPRDGSGFHVNYSNPPINASQGGPSLRLASVMRDQLKASGFQPSSYRGTDGLYGRSDLAGLNLAQYPAILIECGNMKNAADAAMLSSADGQSRLAMAIAQGVAAFLR